MSIPSRRQPVFAVAATIIALALITIGVLACNRQMPVTTPAPTEPPTIKQPEVVQVVVTPVVVESTPGLAGATLPPPTSVAAPKPGPTSTPEREITVNLSGDPSVPGTDPLPGQSLVYTAFDFLRGYLTNRTYSTIVDGKPWTNSTLNWEQYQKELEGVTYWDFYSEPENWDSPSYMWQDDAGQWHPYEKQTIRTPGGQDTVGYVLVDRKGPGAMDKIWFTEDAVWMLTTEQSRKDVGPIPDMQDFLEWGNLEKLGNLRVQVDDRIAYDGPIKDWLSGKSWGLTPNLIRILTWRHREFGSSGAILPVLYQKNLRMTLYGGSKKPKWFLATGMRFADGVRVQPYTGTASDLPVGEMAALARNVLQPDDFIRSLPGTRTFDLNVQPKIGSLLQFNGQGTLSAFQVRIAKSADPRQLWLRVRYGAEVGISLPLIAFFTDQNQIVLHRSTPLGVVEQGDAFQFYSNLPMPFQNGLSLELTTNSSTPIPVSIDIATSRATTNTQLRVQYNEPQKTIMYGPDYRVHLDGDGKLVGLVLQSDEQDLDRIPKVYTPGTTTEDLVKRTWPMGYLEGNLTLTDGAGNSRVFGGQEDWADGGFYFNRGYTEPAGGSNRPFGGILRYKDGKDGYATLFRYFNDLSAFRFKGGLTLGFGHGTWNNNFPVRYGTTVYYYRQQ